MFAIHCPATVTGPDGKVLDFRGEGKLGQLGLTELFLESVEPENADVPISEVLETLPEGEYTFEGSAIEVGEKQGKTIGTALLTHDIPEGPELLSPAEEWQTLIQNAINEESHSKQQSSINCPPHTHFVTF
jgi:hypothetical protein